MSRIGIGISLSVGAAALVALACASPTPPALEEARRVHSAAVADAMVSENAPVLLYEAKQQLDEAEAAWQRGDDPAKVSHLAYLAGKRTEIARAVAEKRVADAEAGALSRERDRTVLEARTREVDLARVEADQARKREAQAQAVAASEAERAAQLEKELEELQAKKTDRGIVLTLGDVLFDFAKANLRSGAQQNLYRLVTFLREHPDRAVLVEGHTDSIGGDDYNLTLSERRADSVRSFRASNGIAPDRIVAKAFGKAQPVASNESDAGRQQNRRVEVVILDPGVAAW